MYNFLFVFKKFHFIVIFIFDFYWIYIFLSYIFSCLFYVFCIVYFPIIYVIFHFFVCVIFFIWGHDQAVRGRVFIDIPKFYKLSWLSNETKNTHFWNMQSFFCYLKCQTENWIALSQSLLHKGWRFISNGRHLQKYKTQMPYKAHQK